ncbi:hypothetical protein DND90_24420 [Pseudomonas syringae pv. maculicola]|nr:hypothetical protein DND90_24420 [Pseudomonas syringae pv. maculicola]
MNAANGHPLATQTRAAALACMEKVQTVRLGLQGCCSPLFAMADIVERLTRDPSTSRRVSVVCASRHMSSEQEGMLSSAWPLKFAAQAGAIELPLIYMISSETSAQLSAFTSESSERGIFCNDIETLPSRWPKGAHPWLPLWLLSNRKCQPYDPADASEARAITLHALRSLYVEGHSGFYYMALHDESSVVAVTGYPQAVVEQLREYMPGRFMGVGADSSALHGLAALSPEWIVVQALTALAEGGQLGYEPFEQALQRYRLA